MTVRIYKDDEANAIFVEDNNGAQFLNNLQAVADSPTDTVFYIRDKSRDNLLLANVGPSDVVDASDQVYGADVTSVVNALNALFSASGSAEGVAPVITSATTVNITAGDVLNYELVASNGVGYEWANLPAGVVPVAGNMRKLVGGSGLAAGTYNITATAVNYYGEASATISLVVASPPYSNTKSVAFQSSDYLDAAANTSNPMYRSGNGSSNGFTTALWFKPGTHTGGAKQTLFSFGGTDEDNEGHVWLYYKGSDKRLYLEYGSKNNNLEFKTATDTLSVGQWSHIVVIYSGGVTGSASGSVSTYYSEFDVYVDGVLMATTNSEVNYGWSGSIPAEEFRLGEACFGGDHLKSGCKIDEFALWDGIYPDGIASLYNSGSTHDLSALLTPPDHWWRMGDGDTFPTIQDNVGLLNFTMYNMTSANIVTDAP